MEEPRDILYSHLSNLLNTREYPKTICPSEVARALSRSDLDLLHAESWRDTMPSIRELVWAMRDAGEVEILQKGEVLENDVGLEQIKGPIRARKTQP
ncbi:hypothetical protein M501DRAFT_931452 [Patellaria atrata CBS 101060]|uniref:DUF3253 domain-containing protein n=1 Tax=Patellaria atrata CBS 101060 TaxID=1346257 RepID=A0A9P4SCC8_9PEZI|nr:hypothetical protein M501DRAFT_931452 [Patellaria atrata CBS 101060]